MGSWNDLLFDGEDQVRYGVISQQLFEVVNQAICWRRMPFCHFIDEADPFVTFVCYEVQKPAFRKGRTNNQVTKDVDPSRRFGRRR